MCWVGGGSAKEPGDAVWEGGGGGSKGETDGEKWMGWAKACPLVITLSEQRGVPVAQDVIGCLAYNVSHITYCVYFDDRF